MSKRCASSGEGSGCPHHNSGQKRPGLFVYLYKAMSTPSEIGGQWQAYTQSLHPVRQTSMNVTEAHSLHNDYGASSSLSELGCDSSLLLSTQLFPPRPSPLSSYL